MNNVFSTKFFCILSFLISYCAFSQLITADTQVWEKANPSAREASRCKDENLLNFHCGIKDKVLKKYIKYSKNKSHTLSLVHASKEDEMIWDNAERNVTLSNGSYKRGKKLREIVQKPSIFTYSGAQDSDNNVDSLKIKFEDQNLYELLFIPRKARILELNKIHSYLSIKYGISLEKGKYYDSDGKVIWDPEIHKEYRYRPTGLGRDDGNELYQKQSSNQADPFLAIGMNEISRTNYENFTVIDNNNFVMWSDDNMAMSLKPEKGLDILERNWEINFVGSKILKTDYQVRIAKEAINPRSLPLSYWMLLKKDNGDIKKIPGTENGNFIFFNKVDFLDAFDTGDKTSFTFAVSPIKDTKPNTPNQDPRSGTLYNEKDLSLDLTKIALYPNPVKKDQNFTIVFPPMENLIISIYDGGGRLVALDKVSSSARSYVNHLPLQSSYLVNITQNGKIIKTFKLIVE
jgi:hypothetical protein